MGIVLLITPYHVKAAKIFLSYSTNSHDMSCPRPHLSPCSEQTFADNAFWNSLKAKTNEFLDSAKIFIENRIERDSKLLASVGLFAWERAKRDVARALPESGRSGAAVGRAVRNAARQLAANSSYAKYVPDDNFVLPPSKYGEGVETSIYEELNTPLDEIRSVTESIRDILSGKTVTTTGVGGVGGDTSARRGLRSVAPAGTGRAAERQRRAYQRRKETVLAREKEGFDKKIRRGVESVTDAAAEIKREMSVEGNKAGYRSEKAVKALEGRAAAAMLEAGITGEGWGQLPLGIGQRFFGGGRSKMDGTARAELKEAAIVVPVLTRDDLLEEKARFAAALRLCLESPEMTWLMPGEVEDMATANKTLDDDALRDVITSMVCIRDDLEIDEEAASSTVEEMDDIVEEIRQMKKSVEDLALLAAVAADYDAAERLKAELFGISSGDEGSLMASIDELVEEYTLAKAQKAAADAAAAEAERKSQEAAAADEADEKARAKVQAAANAAAAAAAEIDFNVVRGDSPQTAVKQQQPEIVDAVVEPSKGPVPFFVDTFVDSFSDSELVDSDVVVEPEAVFVEDDSIRVIGADKVEILMDEDFEDDYFEVKAAKGVSEQEISRELEDAEEKDPPLSVTLLLRSLDIVFFIAEKTLLAVPIIVDTGMTISKRLKKENRNGLGKKGWDKLENVQQGRKRY